MTVTANDADCCLAQTEDHAGLKGPPYLRFPLAARRILGATDLSHSRGLDTQMVRPRRRHKTFDRVDHVS
jgi:hypothetical protein